MSDVTRILNEIEAGNGAAADQLLPLVYQELRQMARWQMARESDTQTLDPTGLVHEAYLRLMGDGAEASETRQPWDSRGHFFTAAAEAMRRILVETARRKRSLKAGGGRRKLPLTGNEAVWDSAADPWLTLDEALNRLAEDDPIAARVAELRLFAGLSVNDAAQTLDMSRATAFRHWAYARARLRLAMDEPDDRPSTNGFSPGENDPP